MLKKDCFRAGIFCALLLILLTPVVEAENIKTPAEENKYSRYSQNEEIARFLSHMDHASANFTVKVVGRTKEMKNYKAQDLFLCILSEEGATVPSELNRDKPTFLLVASQHGNEQSAKEAALWLIRDLADGELHPLLEQVNFLIIPQANPYGNWFDQRRNEQDLDLNRDHVKLEAHEVEAIHLVFRTWMPEVTMDVHEKGDDYYRVSIGCVSNVNIQPELQRFSRDTILAEVETSLEKKGITFQEYLITQRMGVDSSAGVSYRTEDQGRRETMKRFSTTDLNDGRNSLGIYESLSFIQEGASRHDIETLRERTRWQYLGIRFFSESIARHGQEINTMVQKFRTQLLERAHIFSEDDLVHLRMQYARDEKQPTLTIKSFERTEASIRGILNKDKKAGDPLTREDLEPYPYPSRIKIIEEVVKNWFPAVEPTVSISRPLGYVIPAKHQDVVETLLHHGVNIDLFQKDLLLEIEAYKVINIVQAKYDYLPPETIDVAKTTLQTIIKKGDYFVSCAQKGANLIPCLLEPQSQYGFIRYWKFGLVPEKDDIFPFLRVVKEKKLPLIPYRPWS